MPWNAFFVCLFMTFASMVCAQFQFFEQMFGGHHQQQRPTSGGAGQWAAQSEAISCSHYLCPDTLVCVSEPSHCPCPDVQDIKCLIPDAEDKSAATVLCVRGVNECAEVERLARRIGK